MDSSNTTMGLRTIRWDADEGVFINEQAVRFRGECLAVTVNLAVDACRGVRWAGGRVVVWWEPWEGGAVAGPIQ